MKIMDYEEKIKSSLIGSKYILIWHIFIYSQGQANTSIISYNNFPKKQEYIDTINNN